MKKKSKTKTIVIVLVVLLIVGIIFYYGYYMPKKKALGKNKPSDEKGQGLLKEDKPKFKPSQTGNKLNPLMTSKSRGFKANKDNVVVWDKDLTKQLKVAKKGEYLGTIHDWSKQDDDNWWLGKNTSRIEVRFMKKDASLIEKLGV